METLTALSAYFYATYLGWAHYEENPIRVFWMHVSMGKDPSMSGISNIGMCKNLFLLKEEVNMYSQHPHDIRKKLADQCRVMLNSTGEEKVSDIRYVTTHRIETRNGSYSNLYVLCPQLEEVSRQAYDFGVRVDVKFNYPQKKKQRYNEECLVAEMDVFNALLEFQNSFSV